MDPGQERSKRRMKCLPCMLFLLTLLRHTSARPEQGHGTGDNTNQTVKCAENEYISTNGICCDKCSPGFKLKSECTGKGLRSSCEKCSDGTYIQSTNFFRNCFACHQCNNKNEVEILPCTHERNAVCACKFGYYKNVINSITWSCERCKKCGVGERISEKCAEEKNTQCECKDLHYYVSKNYCAPCQNCSEMCPNQCLPPSTTVLRPSPGSALPVVLIPLFASTTILVLLIFVTYVGIRVWRKKRRTLLSPDSEEEVIKQSIVDTTSKDDESTVLTIGSCEGLQHDQKLPDCVPREIKTHDFIYFVLEVVPVNRFKELVRRLNVSEQDIDRAERDNRSFADAQYQMLKIWSDNGAGRGKNVFPRTLLQEFLVILKEMNLNSCTESIENKYCTEA